MDTQIYHLQYIAEEKFWWFQVRNKLVYELILRYCKIIPFSKVLDIGCGTGGFTKQLANSFEVIGLDSSDIAINYCRKRGLQNVLCGKLDDFDFKNEMLHMITLLDVIEHIENDEEMLKKANNILHDNGYIVISVPAYQWLWSNHDVLHHHYRRYTKKSLINLIKKQNFEIIYSSYFNTLLFLPALILRFWGKITGKKSKTELDNPEPLLNPVFKFIFNLERKILKIFKFPFGLSIIVIAKKQIKT